MCVGKCLRVFMCAIQCGCFNVVIMFHVIKKPQFARRYFIFSSAWEESNLAVCIVCKRRLELKKFREEA